MVIFVTKSLLLCLSICSTEEVLPGLKLFLYSDRDQLYNHYLKNRVKSILRSDYKIDFVENATDAHFILSTVPIDMKNLIFKRFCSLNPRLEMRISGDTKTYKKCNWKSQRGMTYNDVFMGLDTKEYLGRTKEKMIKSREHFLVRYSHKWKINWIELYQTYAMEAQTINKNKTSIHGIANKTKKISRSGCTFVLSYNRDIGFREGADPMQGD